MFFLPVDGTLQFSDAFMCTAAPQIKYMVDVLALYGGVFCFRASLVPLTFVIWFMENTIQMSFVW